MKMGDEQIIVAVYHVFTLVLSIMILLSLFAIFSRRNNISSKKIKIHNMKLFTFFLVLSSIEIFSNLAHISIFIRSPNIEINIGIISMLLLGLMWKIGVLLILRHIYIEEMKQKDWIWKEFHI